MNSLKRILVLFSLVFLLTSCAADIPEIDINSSATTVIETIGTIAADTSLVEIDEIETIIEIEEPSETLSSQEQTDHADTTLNEGTISLNDIPKYNGQPYVEINNNIPFFAESDLSTESFEYYSELDSLGRCGVAMACIGLDIMPTEPRGEIGSVKPSGWQTAKYDCVDGKYLYNRCHLLGYQLTGENANEKNLITGTRYMNVEGMLPFENQIDNCLEYVGGHVIYRVTPLFEDDNLVASGVLMEAKSVEDDGENICFNVFCYNVQPGVFINYADGSNYEVDDTDELSLITTISSTALQDNGCSFVLNLNTKKFHLPSCDSVNEMKEKNKEYYDGKREELIDSGYSPCKRCNP